MPYAVSSASPRYAIAACCAPGLALHNHLVTTDRLGSVLLRARRTARLPVAVPAATSCRFTGLSTAQRTNPVTIEEAGFSHISGCTDRTPGEHTREVRVYNCYFQVGAVLQLEAKVAELFRVFRLRTAPLGHV